MVYLLVPIQVLTGPDVQQLATTLIETNHATTKPRRHLANVVVCFVTVRQRALAEVILPNQISFDDRTRRP